MRADTDTASAKRVVAMGLLAAAMLITSCGAGDDGTNPNSDSPAMTEPMNDPSPVATDEPSATETGAADVSEAPDNADEGSDLAMGVYRDYSEQALAEAGYETNVIFFHASWCPECRAFEQSIETGPIPDGVQILKADYDTESELKDRYGVDIQTTFVKVDDAGEMISKWVGYEQDRSVGNLLEQLG